MPAPGSSRATGPGDDATRLDRAHRSCRSRAVQEGTIFIPFAYVEAAANILTNPQLDPIGKIPEYKYCAVRIGRAHDPKETVPEPSLNVTASGL